MDPTVSFRPTHNRPQPLNAPVGNALVQDVGHVVVLEQPKRHGGRGRHGCGVWVWDVECGGVESNRIEIWARQVNRTTWRRRHADRPAGPVSIVPTIILLNQHPNIPASQSHVPRLWQLLLLAPTAAAPAALRPAAMAIPPITSSPRDSIGVVGLWGLWWGWTRGGSGAGKRKRRRMQARRRRSHRCQLRGGRKRAMLLSATQRRTHSAARCGAVVVFPCIVCVWVVWVL